MSLNDVSVEGKLGRLDRQIRLPAGALFTTPYSDSVDLMFGRSFWSDVSGWERFSPRLIFLTLLVLALVGSVWGFGLPAAATLAARITPTAYSQTLEGGTLSALDRLLLGPSRVEPDRQAAITAEFEQLLAVLPKDQRQQQYRLLFRNAEQVGPNAFALPAGAIIVTDQLVELFDDNAVVTAVLGHEIGHVAERHSLKEMYQAAGLALFVGLVVGDVGPILDELLVEANLLQSLRRSRAAESRADSFAVALLRRAERDPTALIRFFERLEAEQMQTPAANSPQLDRLEGWYSTHPLTRTRIEALRKAIDAAG